MDSEEYSGITLFVGTQEVGVLIKDVQEIIEPISILSVPVTHPFFAGLISLRGTIIPLLSLRQIFHASENPFTNKDKKYVICALGSEPVALDIDAVGDTFSFEVSQLVTITEDDANPHQLLAKQVALEDKVLPLISISKLINFTSGLNTEEREKIGY
ncbi:chemotaxis protein CheW [Sporolactobacillus nakayamae]|uniref:chemotaxis protein CheW n=1 Tax=Sporolactobacillus nakayamae TaxID=269670 RepID=UPI001FDF55E9|nr:chemotaxis protein CheW [Sporolactobacillus nakayamae]